MRYELRDVQRIIAYCARVSNPNNQHNSESSDKLLKYLIKLFLSFTSLINPNRLGSLYTIINFRKIKKM